MMAYSRGRRDISVATDLTDEHLRTCVSESIERNSRPIGSETLSADGRSGSPCTHLARYTRSDDVTPRVSAGSGRACPFRPIALAGVAARVGVMACAAAWRADHHWLASQIPCCEGCITNQCVTGHYRRHHRSRRSTAQRTGADQGFLALLERNSEWPADSRKQILERSFARLRIRVRGTSCMI